MTMTITKDMASDPLGDFYGNGALRYPYVPNKITIDAKRNEFSKRSWNMETVTELDQMACTFKLKPLPTTTSNGYLKVGFFNTLAANNETNRLGVEIFRDTSTPLNRCNIFIRGNGNFLYSAGPMLKDPGSTLMWSDVENRNLRFEFWIDADTMAHLYVYDDDTGVLIGWIEAGVLGSFTFVADSFGIGNRSGVGVLSNTFVGEMTYFTARTGAPLPTVKKVPFFMGVVPT